MKTTYKEVTNERGETYLEMTTPDGVLSFVPMVAGNADYERYLNPEAEHFTPNLEEQANDQSL